MAKDIFTFLEEDARQNPLEEATIEQYFGTERTYREEVVGTAEELRDKFLRIARRMARDRRKAPLRVKMLTKYGTIEFKNWRDEG